jgi:glucosamine--fructose-6-phosphate aminotransferase (isomerizing)
MCGIVGYVGERQAAPILMQGLGRLEYRGYDSAGIGVSSGNSYRIVRARGKLAELAQELATQTPNGTIGLAHTRWATHGPPSEINAHPHSAGPISIVHNGIVENFRALKAELVADGHRFASETDSEVIAHLIHREIARGAELDSAVARALVQVEGRYAVVVVSNDSPDTIVVARDGSPLVIGGGDGETFIASDVTALLDHTREVMFLDDGQIVQIARDALECRDASGAISRLVPRTVNWSPMQAEKGGYSHYMLKEIYEQPEAIAQTLAGRLGDDAVILEELEALDRPLAEYSAIRLLACGTSYHAGLVGAFWLESIARVRATCELASEFRYRDPVLDADELIVAISQSGETADTLAALKLAEDANVSILSICNVMDSSIPRASDATLYTRAGPEIGVASTKAFTAQLTTLLLLTLARAELPAERRIELIGQLHQLPRLLEETLGYAPQLEVIARKLARSASFLFLGRGTHFPLALEGALKLKELTYIPAEGYAAGEMKHGPIALIDETCPVIALVPADSTYDRMLSSLSEVKARGGTVVAIATRGDKDLGEIADELVLLPWPGDTLQPLVSALPLQLLAYYAARFLGTDVDQPRNLAKSVTVE